MVRHDDAGTGAAPQRLAKAASEPNRSTFSPTPRSRAATLWVPKPSSRIVVGRAAELLGITQPDVSDLVRGKLARFSMEHLERFLSALDMEVRIQVGPKPKAKERAGISVELVSSF